MCQDAVDTFWMKKENDLVAEGDIGQFYRYVNNKMLSYRRETALQGAL